LAKSKLKKARSEASRQKNIIFFNLTRSFASRFELRFAQPFFGQIKIKKSAKRSFASKKNYFFKFNAKLRFAFLASLRSAISRQIKVPKAFCAAVFVLLFSKFSGIIFFLILF